MRVGKGVFNTSIEDDRQGQMPNRRREAQSNMQRQQSAWCGSWVVCEARADGVV